MRVAIISTPRTCSSMLGSLYAKKFNLTNYSELFSSGPILASVQEKLSMLTTDDITVKITSTTLSTFPEIFDYTTFPWHVFDTIVLAERKDITAQATSWLLLSYAQINGIHENDEVTAYLTERLKTPENIPLNRPLLKFIIETINYHYQYVRPYLLEHYASNLHIVEHELLQVSPQEYLPILSERLGIDLVLEDVDKLSTPTYIDYSPYITAHNLHTVIEEIQQEIINAAKETGHTGPTEGEGSI